MRTITLLTLALALLQPLTTSAEVRLSFSRSKARPGDVTLKVQGAGRTQRVTVPWKVAYDLAWKAKHGGGVKVSTARDGFTGNMLRLVAGQGKDAMIVDRMRRGGPNGQSGASALRIQVGLGQYARRDGYTKNDFTGNDVDHRDAFFGRTQLYWAPDHDNEVRFVLYGERARDGGFVLSDLAGLRQRPNRINQDFEGKADRDIVSGSLTWNRKKARVSRRLRPARR